MKIAHVVPRIRDAASGPSYTVPRLAQSLSEAGNQVELHVLDTVPDRVLFDEVHTYPSWKAFARFGISPQMAAGLRRTAKDMDIMHNHSLWMLPNIYPGRAVRGKRCRLVTSPRGTLSDWALSRNRLYKRLVWTFGQGRVLRESACLHATAKHEWQDIRKFGLKAPVAIIPNGVDIPADPARPRDSHESRRVLFLSRIHPTKGVAVLLRVWRKLQSLFPEWELWIVGPTGADAYSSQMLELAKSLDTQRVHFPGEVCGARKDHVYYSADLFVLPTRSENFGIVVAEALAHGVPVIVTKAAPWEGLEEKECGWWIDAGEEALMKSMREAMATSPTELRAKGTRGRAWMETDFSWKRIGRMMSETYQWLLGGGEAPQWVRLD